MKFRRVVRSMRLKLGSTKKSSSTQAITASHSAPTSAVVTPRISHQEEDPRQAIADAYLSPDVLDVRRNIRVLAIATRFIGAQMLLMHKKSSEAACLSLPLVYPNSPASQFSTSTLVPDAPLVNLSTETLLPVQDPAALLDTLAILDIIGEGASGVVYKAEARKTHCLALKVMPKPAKGSVQLNELLKEQQALKRLVDISGFIQLRASFHDSDNFYLATTLYDGGDLEAEIERCGELDPERAQFYAAELFLGVRALHKRGIIHRDIKPANLLLDHAGHLVIADFGLAEVFDEEEGPDGRICRVPCGTPWYMAPDMLNPCGYDCRVDYWSMAVVVFEMLTGRTPWDDDDATTLLKIIMTETFDIYADDNLDRITIEFLTGMLAKSPVDRLPIEEIMEDPYFEGINWKELERGESTPPRRMMIETESFYEADKTEKSLSFDVGQRYRAALDPYPEYTFLSPLLSDWHKGKATIYAGDSEDSAFLANIPTTTLPFSATGSFNADFFTGSCPTSASTTSVNVALVQKSPGAKDDSTVGIVSLDVRASKTALWPDALPVSSADSSDSLAAVLEFMPKVSSSSSACLHIQGAFASKPSEDLITACDGLSPSLDILSMEFLSDAFPFSTVASLTDLITVSIQDQVISSSRQASGVAWWTGSFPSPRTPSISTGERLCDNPSPYSPYSSRLLSTPAAPPTDILADTSVGSNTTSSSNDLLSSQGDICAADNSITPDTTIPANLSFSSSISSVLELDPHRWMESSGQGLFTEYKVDLVSQIFFSENPALDDLDINDLDSDYFSTSSAAGYTAFRSALLDTEIFSCPKLHAQGLPPNSRPLFPSIKATMKRFCKRFLGRKMAST